LEGYSNLYFHSELVGVVADITMIMDITKKLSLSGEFFNSIESKRVLIYPLFDLIR
jgi:hypothetical protein